MDMKYVILAEEYPIIFHPSIPHSAFKEIDGKAATSAGFFVVEFVYDSDGILYVERSHCFGRSSTLNLDAKEDDEVLISNLLDHIIAYHKTRR